MAEVPSPPGTVEELLQRVDAVRARIVRAGGDPDRVSLVAVTKGRSPAEVALALQAGLIDLGENYAQELVAKASALAERWGPDEQPPRPLPEGSSSGRGWPRWHFIGQLQRNKIPKLAPLVSLWHTVDRPELGEAIARHAPAAAVLVQVNVTGEAQKAGCTPEAAPELVSALRGEGLDVRGLMTVGPAGDPEAARPGFRLLRRLADRLHLPECSMGMSGDLEVAVSEGSTIVRVGTALMGTRPVQRYVRD